MWSNRSLFLQRASSDAILLYISYDIEEMESSQRYAIVHCILCIHDVDSRKKRWTMLLLNSQLYNLMAKKRISLDLQPLSQRIMPWSSVGRAFDC